MALLFIPGFILIFSPCYLAFRIEVLPWIITSAEEEKKVVCSVSLWMSFSSKKTNSERKAAC